MTHIREWFLAAFGLAGGAVSAALGGFDAGLATLCSMMAADYASGLIVAGVFKRSKKSKKGALDSSAGFKGLMKKCMCLLFVLIGHQLDTYIGTNFLRDGVIVAFIANELISIIENAGLMGVPVPAVVSKAIDILNKKGESEGK